MPTPTWRFLPTNETTAQQLQECLHLPPILCRLLAQRGISTLDEARTFFRPDLADLHDPYAMRDMDRAVERLDLAIQRKEKILLYGDYDVDGTTSVALMYSFLSRFHPCLDYYLPDREKEGYGVSLAGVEYARETECSLIIAMDCGIKAREAVELAIRYGIDFITCDHHLPEGELPAAVANLDPKRPDCPYPFKELSGCGIAFKLAQALAIRYDTPLSELEDLLDLVAVSIACDIVPMTGENRTLAHFGMRRLNTAPRLGIWALIERSNRSYPLEISDVVFGIGPLINAAGRLADAREAVRLLLCTDRNAALDYAGALVYRNKDRREKDFAMADAAKQSFQEIPGWESRRSIVLFRRDWHKGILGITASRIAETFHRPTVILTESNGRAVGSARSRPGFDLYAALQQCEDLFITYGGHAHAAGMQLAQENVPAFAEKFERIVCQCFSEEAARPVIDLDGIIRLQDITPEFWRLLRRFGPFGPRNMTPVFVAHGVQDTGRSRRLDNNHVKFSVRQGEGATHFTGIGFGLGETFEAVRGRAFDIAFSIKEENWRGETMLSLEVKDVKAC